MGRLRVRVAAVLVGLVVVVLMAVVLARQTAVVADGATVGYVEVDYAHALWAFDPADDEALAAYATDIFLGRVVAQTGTVGAPTSVPGQDVPQTQFSVKVMRTVKGNARGTVTINQVGGVDDDVLIRRNGRLQSTSRMFLIEGDALVRPGETALFITGWVPELGWYQVVAAGNGHLRASDTRQQDNLVGRFERAAKSGRKAESDE